jgi:dimethylamine--corrinoid protein Co-methyltransferase
MQGTHTQAAGMGGMRAAGDLVARMQMTRGLRLKEAKQYVAEKLGVSTFDLSNPAVMTDVRSEFGFGRIHSYAISQPGEANFIEAKFNISRVLGIPINSVERFKERAGLAPAAARD